MSTVSLNDDSTTLPAGRGLRASLWGAQLLLAAMFLMSGGMKVAAPLDQLEAQMPWVSGALGGLVRFIGVTELLGAVGLVAPAATRILPKLTPLAAIGLLTVMVLASVTHASRGEFGMIAVNAVLGAMALFVAWGRLSAAPIEAR
jgi:hypothetical protein